MYKILLSSIPKATLKISFYSILFAVLLAGAFIKYIEFSLAKSIESTFKQPQRITILFPKKKRSFLEKNPLFTLYKTHKLSQRKKKEEYRLKALRIIKSFPKTLASINNKKFILKKRKKRPYLLKELPYNKSKKERDSIRSARSAIKKDPFVKLSGFIRTPANKVLKGHFEVSVYKSIDPYNKPIGPPLAQSILKQGETAFNLQVPINTRGYIAAFYSGNEYSKNWFHYPGELFFSKDVRQAKIQIFAKEGSLKKIMNTQEFSYLHGSVYGIFSKAGRKPLKDVLVRVRGTNLSTQTDEEGYFELKLAQTEGQFLLEFLKPGHSPRTEEVYIEKAKNLLPAPIELIHTEDIERLAKRLGLTQSPEKSILIVKARGENEHTGLPGIHMQLSLNADGPYYFSASGEIDHRIENTSFDGRAIFFNVKKGVGFLESFILGEDTIPALISSLGNYEFIYKSFSFCDQRIHGKVLNPIKLTEDGETSPIIGARVRVSGSSQWTDSDIFGYFELPNSLYTCGSKITLEFITNNYYGHRYQLKIPSNRRTKMNPIKLYAFPIDYINNMANSVNVKLDPNTGIIIGQTGLKQSLRIDALLDHSKENKSIDFYFDSTQSIKGSHAFTDPNYGTYIIFNAAEGRSILHGYDRAGTLRYSTISNLSPSTITVLTAN